MNKLSFYILEYLKEHQHVAIVDFGSFFLKNSSARVISEKNNILPPSKEMGVSLDIETKNEGFAEFIAEKEGLPFHEAMKFLRTVSGKWMDALTEKGEVNIEEIGVFRAENGNVIFHGVRQNELSPDFYRVVKSS